MPPVFSARSLQAIQRSGRRNKGRSKVDHPDSTAAPEPEAAVSISLRTNLATLSVQRHLEITQHSLDRSTRQMSSGMRVARASDDPAAIGVSAQLQARAGRIQQGIRNVGDALSLTEVADAALSEISSIVDRMRELAEQSASGLVSSSQRSALGDEYEVLKQEIDRITETTAFNGIRLLDGSLSVAGATSASAATVTAPVAQTQNLASAEVITFEDYGVFSGLSQSDRELHLAAGQSRFDVLLDINNNPVIGARVQASIDGGGRFVLTSISSGENQAFVVSSDQAAAANSTGFGTTLRLGKGTDTAAATDGTTIQVGVDGSTDDRISLEIDKADVASLGLATAVIASESKAQAALGALDQVASTIGNIRAELGATTNRFTHAAAGLRVGHTTTLAADARIRDADIAEVTARYARDQIKQQAGVSVLSQANVLSQSALSLLRVG